MALRPHSARLRSRTLKSAWPLPPRKLLHGALEDGGLVGPFPGDAIEVVHLAEVAVVGGFGIDRTEQVQLLDDLGGFEVEHRADRLLDGFVADPAGAERVYANRHRVRVTDGVGELNLRAGGEAGSDDVLRHVAAHVGGAAIHLAGVFARKGPAPVPAHAAVRIDDDFAAGQTRVTLRSADHETAGRID